MAVRTYGKLTDALNDLPPAALVRLRGGTNGRPNDIPSPTGKNWDRDTLLKAWADGEIPKGDKYIIRPVVSGKVSSRMIKLDLSLAEESTTVETGQQVAEMTATGTGYMQAEVVSALTEWAQTDRDRMYMLEDKIEELNDEVARLKLKLMKRKMKSKMEADTDSISATANKGFVEFMKGNGPLLLAHKWSGGDPGALGQMIAAAIQAGAVKGG